MRLHGFPRPLWFLTVALLALAVGGTGLRADDVPVVEPASVHRVLVPASDFEGLMRSAHGRRLEILPLADLRRRLAQDFDVRLAAARSAAAIPPSGPDAWGWSILDATYAGRQQGDLVRFDATWRLTVRSPGWHSIPLLGAEAAVSAASVDGEDARLILEPGRDTGATRGLQVQQRVMAQQASAPGGGPFFLLVEQRDGAKPRAVKVTATFVVPVRTVQYYRELKVAVLPAPTARLTVDLEGAGLDVTVDEGLGLETTASGTRTTVAASLRPAPSLSVQWFRLARPTAEAVPTAEEGAADGAEAPARAELPVSDAPAWVEAQTFQDVAVGEGRVEGTVTMVVTVHRRPIDGVTLRLSGPRPADEPPLHLEVLPATDLIRRWHADAGGSTLTVEFRRPVEGEVEFGLTYAADTRGASTFKTTIPVVALASAASERGWVAVRRTTNVSITETARGRELEEIPLSSVPDRFRTPSVSTALLVYHYLAPPFSLALQVTRHPDAPVLTTVVDRADAGSLVTEDGSCMTRVRLDVRTRTRDPLDLDLSPCGADASVAEVLLDGRPASLAHRPGGGLQVSLADLTGPTADEPHAVELTLRHRVPRLGASGGLALALPRLGVPIKEVRWAWFVPDRVHCFSFEGNHGSRTMAQVAAPVPLPHGGYASYGLARSLLPAGAVLRTDCAFVTAWLLWLPGVLLLAAGALTAHAALVTVVGGRHARTLFPVLLVLLVMYVLLGSRLSGAAADLPHLGVMLYLGGLFVVGVWRLGSRLRAWIRARRHRPMTAVETNIARVAPEVEGGGSHA